MQIRKILILGSGGREHVLANTYAKNENVQKVFVAPGNGLIGFENKKISSLPRIASNDFDAILKACEKHQIDLIDVAQDEPLANGLVDKLNQNNIKAFGPTKDASEIEWNKEWARNFMKKYNLPSPIFKSFSNAKIAVEYVNKLPEQSLFIKASGLALGKGAIYAKNKLEAIKAIKEMKKFGNSGKTFLVEECMVGEEFSLFALCDGKDYVIVGAAQDHKNVYNGDRGPNTGGMGCVFPCQTISKKIIKEVEKNILDPFLEGMQKEERPYSGILYLGGMITKKGVKIVEFNARWGDPEAEVILPALQTDYLKIVESILQGKLRTIRIRLDKTTRISVAGCAYGYPQDYASVKGKKVFGIKEVSLTPNIEIFGAGITKQKTVLSVSGGRIFHVVGKGKDLIQARSNTYKVMSTIYVEGNNLHYRTDIGWRDMQRLYKKTN